MIPRNKLSKFTKRLVIEHLQEFGIIYLPLIDLAS